MSEKASQFVPSVGLVVGSALGMAGTFVHSATARGLLWGIDGVLLTVATALLTIHYLRKGSEIVAAGFLVFAVGEALILSGAAVDLATGVPMFGAGASLWAASLFLLCSPRVAPLWVRIAGVTAGLLFSVVALQIFTGQEITPLSRPLPFFAYPFLAATLLGWAWERFHSVS